MGYVTMYNCMWLPKFQMDMQHPSAGLETRVQYTVTMQNTATQTFNNLVTSDFSQFLIFVLTNLVESDICRNVSYRPTCNILKIKSGK